ncbi:phospholipid-translocating P-type ATPase [Auriscalpium vulgare]|uniref:Phospholipid-translocating P-type ATPase n=1 Tax=Auriscalpium vulgare TaxID=40419 RepID=A0ACB8S6M6_9AGAM|nr:phospholipid-translocating P-type ATPase [Auriscalpium vulgare]
MSFFKRQTHPDELETQDYDANIDPQLRLRTVRTAASTLAESIASEQRADRRKSIRRKRSRFFRGKHADKDRKLGAEVDVVPVSEQDAKAAAQILGNRRNIYVNTPLTAIEVDRQGEPTVRYPRNKIRTSKYTVVTFIPKNLYEQFRRVANLYFLALVVLQLFPVFGAAGSQISFLPLLFIITVTAVKDAVEDYRRAALDEEVNTYATTKLGNWQNVNQPTDPRNWLEKTLRINPPGHVTKGVRKLRDREAEQGMRVILSREGERISMSSTSLAGASSLSLGRRLDDIQSVDSHSYPPADPSQTSLATASQQLAGGPFSLSQATGSSTLAPSSPGVINWGKRITGMSRWERTLWKKLEVGDIVLLRDNEQVPADIIVLATSDPDGLCYVETKNLDGETNLKPRKAVHATSHILSEEDVERSAFVLDSEPPHQNLYTYNGVLRYPESSTGEMKAESITINEMLLRGCSLRNTAWVIGLVAFTGADTKILLNGGETPSKRSKIEKETNFNVVANFVLLLAMCIITGIVNGIFDARTSTSSAFFEVGEEPSDSHVVNALVTFGSSLIAFQNIVPISLYISIEIVKTIQAYFIAQDIDMFYQPLESGCVPKTWNISDDLGQIEYIFSDKTGTLTQNIMEFQKCSINGVTYGEAITEAQRGAARREGRTDLADPEEHNRRMVVIREDMLRMLGRSFKNRYSQPDKVTLVSLKLAEDMADRSSEQRSHIIAFFRALSVCHGVLADRPDSQNPFQLEYKAESPDESALVAAARDIGFPFTGKNRDSIDIEVMGQTEKYTPLKVLEFNSTRKRMSVIVRNPQGRIILYCKGADSVIYERLAPDHDPELKAKTSSDMEAFANSGLRTLCIAYREMGEDEYLQWSRVYDAATSSVKDRDEEIDKANAQVEHTLRILGATALEDKLQEGVPDAIETLHQAGIKLWILTGDKVQTAIEIAFSCNLLKSDMDIMILSADTVEGARVQIEAGLNKIASVLGPPTWDPRKRGFAPNAKASFAIVIDGDTLTHALDPELKELFLNLGTQCETVVCCRVSPAQKALTVKLVKDGRNAMTLSIGDGANDVAMIQEANVGVGLNGLEGSQAAMSADYAFGQFRYLTKLLLVHGRWSYRRIADMHGNFFYKNVIWTFALFWYLPFNGFDATYLYEYTFILLYNLVFTSLPVIILGAFDQDINAKAALAFPQLYIRGIRGLEYTRTQFWLYMGDGLYQSGVVFFIPYLVWTLGPAVSWNGKGIESLTDFGTTVAVSAIFAANTYVGINTQYWTVITWLVIVGSSLVVLVWIIVYSFFTAFEREVQILFGGVTFWATVVLAVSVALLPRLLAKFISTTYFPQDSDIVREMWVKGDLKDRLGIKHHRDRRNSADLERTPMFQKPHMRSVSELSTASYEPALTRSPGVGDKLPIAPHADTPPNTSPYVPTREVDEPQYVVSTPTVAEPPTPTNASQFAGMAPSPQPSYYSASDIPPPSPMASPVYQHPSQAYAPYSPPPSATLQVPHSAYEMRVRSPSHESNPYRPHADTSHLQDGHPAGRRELTSATDDSYVTAGDDDDGYGHYSEQGADRHASTYSGPRVM